jgi:hypothetical protein
LTLAATTASGFTRYSPEAKRAATTPPKECPTMTSDSHGGMASATAGYE